MNEASMSSPGKKSVATTQGRRPDLWTTSCPGSQDHLGGKLLLLYGPPGTGKTTALRALADAWRSWCRFDYVVDPERLFGSSAYLLKIALHDDEEDEEEERAE